MAPPAATLPLSDDPSYSKIPNNNGIINNDNNNNSSRSSEEERESIDGGAIDELPLGGIRAGKRPRGRPPGSKNKPKAPTYLSVDPQDALRSHVMEVSSGADIVSSLSTYARARGRGLAVLHAVGSVAGATFRHHESPLLIKGKLDLISLSGTVLPDNTILGPAGLTIFVAGPHGQVIGGPVDGRLVAAGTVLVMAATFSTATYEKLPLHAEAAPTATNGLGPGQELGPVMEDPRSTGYHPGFNMMENGSSSGVPPPDNSSYAWVHQQHHHHENNSNNNNRPPYM